jgi:hypothetical protein
MREFACIYFLIYGGLTTLVFGMGLDLSAFLAVYTAVMAGDLTSFSIGGKPKIGGLLGGAVSSLGLLGEP